MNRTDRDRIIFDGVNPITGEPVASPIQPSDYGRHSFRDRLAKTIPSFGLTDLEEEVQPERGIPRAWGLVCRPTLSTDIRKALQPLLEKRKGQIYNYEGERSALTWARHLEEKGQELAGNNLFFLLVGSPQEISFDFEKMLTPQHVVGRLDLPDASAYEIYVQQLLAYEKDEKISRIRRKEVEFFASDDTEATEVSVRKLVRPLANSVGDLKASDYKAKCWIGAEATRQSLTKRFKEYQEIGAPAVIFMASHGAEVARRYQFDYQGSWIPQGASILGHTPDEQEIREQYLTGSVLTTGDYSPYGAVVFNFSCFGGGLHQEFTLRQWQMEDEIVPDDPQPIVSALGKNILGNPRPALAYISALDRTGNIFSWQSGFRLFEQCLRLILKGQTIGEACHGFWEANTTHRQSVEELLEDMIQRNMTPKTLSNDEAYELGLSWWMADVLDNFVIQGDPAVALHPLA